MNPETLLRRLALHLGALAVSKLPVPLLDGSSASLSPLGMAFLAQPARRGSETAWFRRTGTFLAAQAAQAPVVTDQREFFLVVQWRRLLGKALLRHPQGADVPAELRRLAHLAWWTAIPVVRQHDVVMARLLERSYANFTAQGARASHEPFWVGFDNEDDEHRFDKQAVALLNSRRTADHPHDGFCEAAARWLADGFGLATPTSVQAYAGRCTVTRHTRNQACPTCPEISKERAFLTALSVPLLTDAKMRQCMSFSAGRATKKTHDPSLAVDAMRWLLEAARVEDGIYPFRLPSEAAARFIDMGRVRKVWAELQFPTPFDQLSPVEAYTAARESVKYLERMLGGLVSSSIYNEAALVAEAGWSRAEDYDPLYGGYAVVLDSALACQIELADRRAGALAKARAGRAHAPVPVRRPPRRTVTRMFQPLSGPAVAVGIVRAQTQGKQTRNFFSTPFGVDDPMTRTARLRIGKGLLDGDTFFWTLATLNHFANQQTVTGAPVYPLAREFCDWAARIDAELVDRKSFNEAVYSDRLNVRLAAIARGDLAHLGAYSRYEDEQITEFFVTKQAKRRLSDEDWAALLLLLPGRSRTGILRRFDELGKRYAFTHGYAAYLKSPYHRKFSATRRKQWMKEGCAP